MLERSRWPCSAPLVDGQGWSAGLIGAGSLRRASDRCLSYGYEACTVIRYGIVLSSAFLEPLAITATATPKGELLGRGPDHESGANSEARGRRGADGRRTYGGLAQYEPRFRTRMGRLWRGVGDVHDGGSKRRSGRRDMGSLAHQHGWRVCGDSSVRRAALRLPARQ